jgi:hypothetical protein
MTVHITAANSSDVVSGNAFTVTVGEGGQDAFIVDADAFLISQNAGDGAFLTGVWTTVTINGEVGSFGAGFHGLVINPKSRTDVSNVTVGRGRGK